MGQLPARSIINYLTLHGWMKCISAVDTTDLLGDDEMEVTPSVKVQKAFESHTCSHTFHASFQLAREEERMEGLATD